MITVHILVDRLVVCASTYCTDCAVYVEIELWEYVRVEYV